MILVPVFQRTIRLPGEGAKMRLQSLQRKFVHSCSPPPSPLRYSGEGRQGSQGRQFIQVRSQNKGLPDWHGQPLSAAYSLN